MPIGPVMLDVEGEYLSSEDRELLLHPLVGGVIYFSRNFKSYSQISELTKEIKSINNDMLIAVDQEGGRVQRFKNGFTRLPAMQQFLPLYRKQPTAALNLVKDCGWLMAVDLLTTGIDFSFAPVLDVDDHHCDVIADRSFSPVPEEVSDLAGAFIEGMHDAGMAATGKHFPGHGSVTGDSHLVLPQDLRPYTEIEQHDLVPFKALMSDVDALMPAHIVFPDVDNQPVGFSSYWLQTILRQQLQFQGVIFSDDLSMEGAVAAGSYGQRAQMALQAGCDMVLVCNNREGAKEVIQTLEIDHYSASNDSVTRLKKMSARQHWQLSELKNFERYQKITRLISTMTSAGS